MRKSGWQEQLRKLDEMAMAFKVARRVSGDVSGTGQGWLRAVRQAVGIPVMEAAERMGVGQSEVFRMEYAEGRGVIELGTLRRAAEALGCELVYGLTPKEGTLAARAAAIEAEREKKQEDAWARKLKKAKDQRREAAKKRWLAQEHERQERYLLDTRKLRQMELPENLRGQIPGPPAARRFSREQMRKALRMALRKEGIRLR